MFSTIYFSMYLFFSLSLSAYGKTISLDNVITLVLHPILCNQLYSMKSLQKYNEKKIIECIYTQMFILQKRSNICHLPQKNNPTKSHHDKTSQISQTQLSDDL